MLLPATIRGFIVLLTAHASIDLKSDDSLTPRVVKRESTSYWGTCVDLFCHARDPNRSNNSVDRCCHDYRIVRHGVLSSTGRDIIWRAMPCGKFGCLAGRTIAPHGGALKIW